ncbi:hypothetical protein MRX96_031558 [Rhipicephalus microplus]
MRNAWRNKGLGANKRNKVWVMAPAASAHSVAQVGLRLVYRRAVAEEDAAALRCSPFYIAEGHVLRLDYLPLCRFHVKDGFNGDSASPQVEVRICDVRVLCFAHQA